MSIVSDYTAILALTGGDSFRWNGPTNVGAAVFVTYSFADGDFVPSTADYSPYDATGYSAFTEAQRDNFRDALQIFEETAGIIFVEVDEGGMIDVFNATGSSWGGWANYPVTSKSYTSDGYLVIDSSGSYDSGTYGFETLLHEIGHAVGLEHTHSGVYTLEGSLDDNDHSVMTYNHSGDNATTLGSFDIQALQHIYGDIQDTTGWVYGFNGDVFEITGAAGGDFLFGIDVENKIVGKNGKDHLYGREFDDVLKGGGGSDTLVGLYGDDRLFGGNGNDKMYGGAKKNGADVNDGADKLFGGAGNDKLYGQGNNDTLKGEDGDDHLDGGWGSDKLYGGDGDDVIFGDNNDTYWGSDKLYGEAGRDTLYGDNGSDTLNGGSGADILYGGGHNDKLVGGKGNDTLFGGDGIDDLIGGKGRDELTGGASTDYFIFSNADAGKRDTVTDFTDGVDYIQIFNTAYSFADVVISSFNEGADTLIVVGGAIEVLLLDVDSSLISNSDFYI